MSGAANSVESEAFPASGPEIHCLQCGYNVAGLDQNRCPECGQPFDPLELRALWTTPTAATPWDRDRNIAATAWFVLMQPVTFARAIPPYADCGSAWHLRWTFHAVGLFILLMVAQFLSCMLLSIAGLSSPSVSDLLLMVIFILVGLPVATIIVCPLIEIGLAGLFWVVAPPRRSVAPYHHWRYVCHAYSGVLIVSAGLLAAVLLISTFWPPALWAVPAAGAVAVMIWVTYLGIHLIVRAQNWWAGVHALVLVIPAAFLIIVLAGATVGLVIGFLGTALRGVSFSL